MPIISASRQLKSLYYLVLKKANGNFGPRVKENLFRPANIYIATSKLVKLINNTFSPDLSMYLYPLEVSEYCYYCNRYKNNVINSY